MAEKNKKEVTIRSSAAEYLTYVASVGDSADSIEMRYEDENIWLTQKMLAELYDVSIPAINQHLKKIYADCELEPSATIKKYLIVQTEGNRTVSREVDHYNLNAIIAVGFKVNNQRAVRFRVWANQIVEQYTVKGWAMDVERLKNGGSILTEKYFDEQLERIREIRLSERKFYQKLTDIYATAADKPHMGLTSWKAAPDGKISRRDVSVAKNYLTADEMASLELIVSAYLDLAENRTRRKIPMTMEDWAKRIDIYLAADDLAILQNPGKITAAIAKDHAETEFEKYRIIQDKLFMSDYDRYLLELEEKVKVTGEKE